MIWRGRRELREGNLAQQNQLNFSNTAFQRQMAALQGLSGLFGVDSNLLGRTGDSVGVAECASECFAALGTDFSVRWLRGWGGGGRWLAGCLGRCSSCRVRWQESLRIR